MISKQISLLEDKLGARLLHRSTRNAQLTYVGEAYLQRARNILAKIEDADNFVQDLQETSPWEIENQRSNGARINGPVVFIR